MLDNIAGLLLMVGLLAGVFGFPTTFALRYMVPGTAIGVLVGDLLFFWLAFRLARRTGRDGITAMPLGLDTPSTFGMVFFVLGPAFLAAKQEFQVGEGAELNEAALLRAALHTWHIGIWSIVISGVFKFACALGSHGMRQLIPRAGLLGSLSAVALVLISFLPLVEILHTPVVGLTALAIILTTLVARVPLPFRVPGALGALLVAGGMFYLMQWTHLLGHEPSGAGGLNPAEGLLPYEWLTVFQFGWLAAFNDSLYYLPIVIPFALATVIGGIDCTESAAAAGDEFPTNQVIGIEALATLVAGLCGGVIQTTPYIGHPAYKAMGGRAAYTLATALFVGSAGLLGYFGYLYVLIPKAAVFPILVFIGLEITSQSFQATPRRHYPAVVLACVPALAALVMIYVGSIFGGLAPYGASRELLPDSTQGELLIVQLLSAGFIVTSLLWASALAAVIDRRLYRGAFYFATLAACTLFGVIHSPFDNGQMFLPWALKELPETHREFPWRLAGGYLTAAALLAVWQLWLRSPPIDTDAAFDALHPESPEKADTSGDVPPASGPA